MSTRFGKYVLHERIGAGGMAEVWRATLPGAGGIDKPCVLKRILPEHGDEPDIVRMFLEEARISISLQHGNVVPVFDFGEVEGTYYLAMEYVAGKDLRAIVRRCVGKGTLVPISLATFVVIEVCRGLAYAHAKTGPDGKPLGLVHRDVSPSNILLSFEGDVRLADFGIAKVAAQSRRTDSFSLKGKVAYMSPEQTRGERVDARTDIYATGVVLYEVLTGRRPFEDTDRADLLLKVRGGEFPPPRALRPDVPPELDEAVRTALARDRADRFPDARSMQVALSRFLGQYDSAVTGADLAAFVRALFGEESTRLPDTDPGRAAPPRHDPWRTTEPLASSLPVPDGRPTVPEGLRRGPGAPSPAGLPTPPAERTPPPRRPRRLAATLAALAGALALAAAFVWIPGGEPARAQRPATPPARTTGRASTKAAAPIAAPPRPAAPPPVTKTPPTPAPAPAPVPPRDVAAVDAPRPGTLIVNATPWAEVHVDGRRRAESTPATLRLPAGPHVILLVNPEISVRRTEHVVIRPGETTRLGSRLR